MARSKLEQYESVICALAKNPLKLDGLAFECGTSCVLLQERLEFLVNCEVVTVEVSRDGRVFYLLTSRGLAIAKAFVTGKRLRKLQTSPQGSAQSLQAVPDFPEEYGEKAERVW
jgi:predicted transcriptional regulator